MTTVQVEIKGTTPLLQHRFTEAAEMNASTRNILVEQPIPRDEARKCAYIDPKTNRHWFPGGAVSRLLRESGGNHKLRGSRRSAKFVVPAAVIVMDDAVTVLNSDTGRAVTGDEFEVDSRPVVIPSTKGRVMRHRPRHDKWAAKFNLRINEAVLPVEFVHKLLGEGGQQIGLGDFRPEKGGPFGTFRVVSWKEETG